MSPVKSKSNFSEWFKPATILLAIATIILTQILPAQAGSRLWLVEHEPEVLNLVVGSTLVMRSSQPVNRVYVTNPDVARADVFSPSEIVLTGTGAGTTTLNVWHNQNQLSLYKLDVRFDLARLKQNLYEMFPDEKELRITAAHENITLSGRVSSAEALSEILAITSSYASQDRINNLVQVGGVHQVMLEVRVAEMSRNLGRQLGVNFAYARGKDFAVSTLGDLTQVDIIGNQMDFTISPVINALLRFHVGSASWTGFIDALKSEGLIKIMAEPTLIASSGQTARFLAGGEFPYPVPAGDDRVAIEFREFGVGLEFTPRVLSDQRIVIHVAPEVSDLNYTRSLQYQGIRVPGISTRKVSTTVELASGESFAIAGLLKETVTDNVDKFPVLGDVPVLGALFRSQSFMKGETELVIIITPHLVRPLDITRQTLPTDFYQQPSSAEWYLMGLIQGRSPGRNETMFGRFDGDFGHALPE